MRGSVRRRSEGVYEVRVFSGRDPVTGKKRYVSRTYRGTQRGAETFAASLVTEVANGGHSSTRGTVEHLLDRWIEEGERLGRSPSTLHTYRAYITNNIVPAIGDIELRRLTAGDLDALYTKLSHRGAARATIRQHHAIIRAALNKARKWRWVDENVADFAEPPELGQHEITAPAIADVRRFLTAAEKRNPTLATLVFVAGTTGARRGELCALRWRDVEADSLTIRQGVTDLPGHLELKDTKTHQVRRLAVDPATAEVLERHRRRQVAAAAADGVDVRPECFVFSQDPAGTTLYRPDRVTGFVRRLSAHLGISLNLKALRHLVATEGVTVADIRNVAGRLGHGSGGATTMKVYSHRSAPVDQAIAEHMGQLLTGAVTRKSPRARPKP